MRLIRLRGVNKTARPFDANLLNKHFKTGTHRMGTDCTHPSAAAFVKLYFKIIPSSTTLMYDQLTAILNANMEALFVAMTTIRELDL